MIIRNKLAIVLVAASLLSSGVSFAADDAEAPAETSAASENPAPTTSTSSSESKPSFTAKVSDSAGKFADFVNRPVDFILNLSMEDILRYKLSDLPLLGRLSSNAVWAKAAKAGITAALAVFLAKNETVKETAQNTLNRIKRSVGIEVEESCKKSCKRSACKKAAIEEAQEKWATEAN